MNRINRKQLEFVKWIYKKKRIYISPMVRAALKRMIFDNEYEYSNAMKYRLNMIREIFKDEYKRQGCG